MGMILRPFLDSMNMNPEVLEDSEESGFEGFSTFIIFYIHNLNLIYNGNVVIKKYTIC